MFRATLTQLADAIGRTGRLTTPKGLDPPVKPHCCPGKSHSSGIVIPRLDRGIQGEYVIPPENNPVIPRLDRGTQAFLDCDGVPAGTGGHAATGETTSRSACRGNSSLNSSREAGRVRGGGRLRPGKAEPEPTGRPRGGPEPLTLPASPVTNVRRVVQGPVVFSLGPGQAGG